MTHHDHLLQRQIELEIEMSGLGRSRYLSNVRKAVEKERGFETDTGRCILEASVGPVADGIKAYVDEAMAGKTPSRAVAVRLIKDMDPQIVSYLACRAVLGRMMKPRSPVLLTLAIAVARQVELEARFTAFLKADPKRFEWLTKNLSDTGATEQHKATVLTYAMGKNNIPWDRWSRTDMIHLGIRLIELIASHTGLINIEQAHQGGDKDAPRDQYIVNLTERASAWIDQSVRGGSLLSPAFMPTLIPPKDWTGLEGGGYFTDLDRPLPLVRRARRDHMDLLKQADLSTVIRGLNAIQRTPWRINTSVLDVMHILAQSGDGVAGLVPSLDMPMPERPVDIDTNAEALRKWKWEARDTYTANLQLRQDRLKQDGLLNLAQRFRDERSIYFPHNLDFRGRAYPVVDVLNPQGSDPVKGLLQFSEGKPLGYDGGWWMAVHGANTFGIDKVAFEDRVAWVAENERQIVLCAQDPLDYRWWTEADKPWCFLAFCFEWAQYVADPETFVSRLPVALDGSCNGLQHFSAMLRDSVGGAAVNLIPSDKPQDIYQVVADRVMAQLRLNSSRVGADTPQEPVDPKSKRPSPHQVARWSYVWSTIGIDRKVTKRPVMVLPYGGTPRSCLKYVQEAIKAKGIPLNLGDEEGKAVGYLSSTVWDSIGDVVVAARDAMDWLQKTARVVAKRNLPMHWTAPSGFVAYQGYLDLKSRRLDTKIAGRLVRARLFEETDQIDRHKQATSISPNFVHSLDAAAMTLTVDLLAQEGLTAFAMIHDSYGTHACNATLLSQRLREVFVAMYEGDPLADLAEGIVYDHPDLAGELPEMPTKGTLDLSQTLVSDFFFA